ncbi:phage tail protein [Sinorhizobium medicae]|uniref:Phage tail protein n=1 Tax=Sinorhizobium medicae TaxID=110321 RepID=A0A6G1WUL1_9HYPH|nr:phage tail protein [Sinorhizobium medicae]MDX0762379.1 phage tail protein [Sinorhizobium medicae]MDX0823502.1 phage tail protein [Sinorhizobium medicae]MDX1059924.1 phage tail protein [Sinorhizobium medicae]MQW73450.1 phage tail protein [Sinorhizobium medicae]MQX49602.1 phage tail protein [Sinorhizobium medicae]
MALGLAPLTELDAVNEILGTIAESPVNSLDEEVVIDGSLAMKILKTTSAEVQTRGWWFNRLEGLELTPDVRKEIQLPPNVLKLAASGQTASKVVQRGLLLYDLTNKTSQFEAPVTVDLIQGLEFEELPSSARVYITVRAARKYQDRYFGDDSTHSYSKQDEVEALVSLKNEDLEFDDPNMLEDSQFVTGLRKP